MSEGPLILAIPSKGRLQENAAAFFARAGLVLERPRGTRDYRGGIAGLPDIEILFLSAAEIVTQLGSGGAHLGVTGEDLLREAMPGADAAVLVITALGFGHANLVVAVPQTWIDVRTMADLDEVAEDLRGRRGHRIRVATKYLNLTRRFFAEKGVFDYRIVESLGATEGAPASGAADLIVDITTTGATLAANGLKVIEDGTILRSQASLIASIRAPWGERARNAARQVLARIAAEEEARTTREVRAATDDPDLRDAVAGEFGAVSAASHSTGEMVLHCPAGRVFEAVERLIAAGARDITVRTLDYVFRPENVLFARLVGRLGPAGS